jgi:hypothetical protein
MQSDNEEFGDGVILLPKPKLHGQRECEQTPFQFFENLLL